MKKEGKIELYISKSLIIDEGKNKKKSDVHKLHLV
jgi:hypothetical protein